MNQASLSALIWSVADLLRGDYKQSEYGRVILPFTVLRRLDCVLEASKPKVLAEKTKRKTAWLDPDPFLRRVSDVKFYNTSTSDLPTLMGDQDHIESNLTSYVQGFSPEVREIFERFDFATQVNRLAKADLLYLVTEKFANVDLHPDRVDNVQMGLVFEELIRKFTELSNETAGEHFTPREVIRLMVNLIFIEDDEVLTPGHNVVRTIYDPTAGTGGMLSVAAEFLRDHNPDARLSLYGQELNDESYAICKADMLIRGQEVTNMVPGNTLSDDGHAARKFDYMLSNPPFGVEWKKVEKASLSISISSVLLDKSVGPVRRSRPASRCRPLPYRRPFARPAQPAARAHGRLQRCWARIDRVHESPPSISSRARCSVQGAS